MCGRYKRRSDKQRIAEAFHVKAGLDETDFAAEDDIAPGSIQPVVRVNDEGQRSLDAMYWGFKLPTKFVFNARSDSLLKNGLWKAAFGERRCIVPADSFFEWKRIQKRDNPKYEITMPGSEPFGMAGIWSVWKNSKDGTALPTVAIITTEPNEGMAAIHDRQPAILEPREYEEWLTPSERPPLHLLRVLPSEEMNIRLMETHSMQLPLNSV
ncbi:MAG TPA: SOS response-associated peptidase [Edaphobacter sp.]|nr:SOS response-associated peptidase [Edaphobacter sp.]